MRSALVVLAMLVGGMPLGCGSAQDSTTISNQTAAATLATFNADGAPTVEFSVPDMMCEDSCCPRVRETLAAQPGVKDVKVDLATKTATVAVDKVTFDPEAAIAALVDLQFVHTTRKDPTAVEKAAN